MDNAMTRKKPSRPKDQKASQLRRLLLSNAINPAQPRSRIDVGRTSDKIKARAKQKRKIVATLFDTALLQAICFVLLYVCPWAATHWEQLLPRPARAKVC